MKETVLHVGLHKTASTFLQTVVFPLARNWTVLTRPYTQCNHAFNQLQYSDDSLYRADQVRAELAPFQQKRLLISDESLSGKPVGWSYINRSTIARRLAEIAPSATVLVFLRGQPSMLASQYNQYVKRMLGTKTPEDFVWQAKTDYSMDDYFAGVEAKPNSLLYNTNSTFLHPTSFRYVELLNLYYGLFESVEVFLYEDLVHEPVAVYERLEEIFACKFDRTKLATTRRENPSIGATGLRAQRVMNRVALMFASRRLGAAGRWLCNALPSGTARRECVAFTDIARDNYRGSNRELSTQFPTLGIDRYPNDYPT